MRRGGINFLLYIPWLSLISLEIERESKEMNYIFNIRAIYIGYYIHKNMLKKLGD